MYHPTSPLDPDDHDREDDYEDAELEGIEPIYQSPGLTVRPLTAEQARRLVEGWTRDPATRPRAYTTTPFPAPAPAPSPSQPDRPAWSDGAARPGAAHGSPGASAHAQYRRLRAAEWAAWTRGLGWRLAICVGAGLAAGLAVGLLGLPPGGRAVAAVLVTAGVGWRLRFRASAEARAWRRGAAGERRTARLLRRLERDGYTSLHDLAVPGSAANLDHLVIGTPGVFVIDSKHYRGPLYLSRDGGLWHGRYPMAAALSATRWEADKVQATLGVPDIDVVPIVAVHGAAVPFGQVNIHGIPVVAAASLAGMLRALPPVLAPERAAWAAVQLRARLRPALTVHVQQPWPSG
jgi:hypothetical protein